MAAKGTAAKSASGAAMSKYDVEVEARLKKLEAQAHPDRGGAGGVDSDLAAKIEELYTWYQSVKKKV